MIEHKSGKKWVSDEEVRQAKNIDLAEFLMSEYPGEIEYSKKKMKYRRTDDHGIEIFTAARMKTVGKPFLTWCDYTSGRQSGDNINYMEKFHHMGFQEAVIALLRGRTSNEHINEELHTYQQKKQPEKEIEMPARNDTYDYRIKYYITEIRKIDKSIFNDCWAKGILYSDNKGNCVFANPEQHFWAKRSAMPGQYFKQSSGGVGYWVYKTAESVKTVYICEAPIDCLSLAELQGKPDNTAYVAMLGLIPENAKKAMSDFAGAEVKIAVDWDEPGKKFYKDNFSDLKFFHANERFLNNTKDWNELLQLIKEIKGNEKKGKNH
jgi:hypothetical protein